MKQSVLIILSFVFLTAVTMCGEDPVPPVPAEAEKVIIIFDACGGSQPVPVVLTNMMGSNYGPLPETFRVSYDFGGWWTGTNGQGYRVYPDSAITNTTNHCLYARWNAKIVTNIVFHVQDGRQSIPIEEKGRISYSLYPPDALNTNLSWTAGDQNILVVTSDGTITPLSRGTTWVQARSPDGAIAQCTVQVRAYGIVALSDKKIWYGEQKVEDPVSGKVIFQWYSHASSAGTRSWYAVAGSRAGDRLAAVVNRGYIYTSADRGKTWMQCPAGERDWMDIASSHDGRHLVAADGDDGGSGQGEVFTSHDAGVTWIRRSAAGKRDWKKVASSADGMVLTAIDGGDGGDSGGNVFISRDRGASWVSCPAGSRNWTALAMSATGKFIVAADSDTETTTFNPDYGNLFYSGDFGETWSKQSAAGSRDWNSLAISDDGSCIFATDGINKATHPFYDLFFGSPVDLSSGDNESDLFVFDANIWERKTPSGSVNYYGYAHSLGDALFGYVNRGSLFLQRGSQQLRSISHPVAGQSVADFFLFGEE